MDVLSPEVTLITQVDYAPHEGRYPTNVWSVGEVVRDCIQVDVAADPANGSLSIGLYEPLTGQVLAISDAEGQPLSANRLVLIP